MKKLCLLFLVPLLFSSAFAQDKILFIGDSLTAGYGIDKEKSYPVLVKKILKLRYKKDVKIINGSVSGSTTASALSRLKWFQRSKAKLLVLALGSNDGLRGINLKKSQENLAKTIEFAKKKDMEVVLAGMMLPPNYGKKYTNQFRAMYKSLASKYKITLIPFLLKDVAAKDELNISDGIHPNEKGHAIMAETVVKYLKDLI